LTDLFVIFGGFVAFAPIFNQTFQAAVHNDRSYSTSISVDSLFDCTCLFEYLETASMCQNAEVSLAALKSFQEILQISKDKPEDQKYIEGLPLMTPPPEEVINRSEVKKSNKQVQSNKLSTDKI
jgi:hypothetical protein